MKTGNPICAVCKTNETPGARHEFCEACAHARRSWQLKVNNEKWKARKQEGGAANRILYNGAPTRWALENPVEAVELAFKLGYDRETLKRLIRGLGNW